MAQITLDKAREVCTAAELQLVRASRPPAVGKLELDELKKYHGQARRLRDKWRDLATRQRRESQRRAGARVTDASARSGLKADLFQQALDKFQQQLDKQSAAPQPQKNTADKSDTKQPSKKKRTVGHRQSRASTRAALADQQEEMAVKRVKKKKAARKQTAQKPTTTSGTASSGTSGKKANQKQSTDKQTSTKKPAKKKATANKPVRGKAAAKKAAAREAAKVAGNVPTDAQLVTQKKLRKRVEVEAKAKGARILKSGLTTRTRGHVSARGKRAQGRRDSR